MNAVAKGIGGYLAMAFGFTWVIAGVGAWSGITASSGLSYLLLAGTCMFGPAIAAIIQQRLFDKAPWSGLGLPLKGTRWSIVALTALVGMAMVPTALLTLHVFGQLAGFEAFGRVSITSERIVVSLTELLQKAGQPEAIAGQLRMLEGIPAGVVLLVALLGALLAAVTINLPFMLGEELGWRGYLWQRTEHWSGMRRVGFTGVVWGLWHAPLIAMGHNYPDHPIAGIGMMTLFCVLLALLFDWTRTRSRSIWSSCLLHGVINGSAGAMALFAWGGHPLVGSLVGVAGFVAFALLGALILLFDARYRAEFMAPRSVADP